MKQRHFMVALDMLDEERKAHTEAVFVPAVELSAEGERNAEAEIAAFVNRPDPTHRVEASRSTRSSNDAGAGTGRTPFSEAAGFSTRF
ncbi:hypothetical protein [Halomonas binhaiensis]|uniref:Uncharacterized protein n=1 Tax=Halomonas binhaiensis TaxID=2562282 RepID=A0A5C1NK26_9GAMM|nr:hypothetical protein [Halomonas binhaiensis]QEM82697.1 hypothetical protein E4T21_14930 [Halomonas binhaiensis]